MQRFPKGSANAPAPHIVFVLRWPGKFVRLNAEPMFTKSAALVLLDQLLEMFAPSFSIENGPGLRHRLRSRIRRYKWLPDKLVFSAVGLGPIWPGRDGMPRMDG